jgi:hypothetical protein
MPKIVGFISEQLCERGTTVAMYDYAVANEKCGNVSIIFHNPFNPHNCRGVVKKFKDRFSVLNYRNFQDIELYIKGGEYAHLFKTETSEGIEYLYAIKHGQKDNNYTEKVPCLIHSVFVWDPHGSHYACVSRQISPNGKWLPHIIDPLPTSLYGREKFRIKHDIPFNAYVYGRHGGIDTFNISYVYQLIAQDIDKYPNIWFVFVNTMKFIEHPRVIFLPVITNLVEKGDFILGCDAMIHGRLNGETFGLAVAEFISLRRPVLTCPASWCSDNEHIYLGKDWVYVYYDIESLRKLLWKVPLPIPQSPNPYEIFSAKNIMPLFGQLLGYRADFEIKEN